MPAQLDQDYFRLRPGKAWSRLVAYMLFEGRPLTAKGRWINPVIFALYRLCEWLPLPEHDPAPILITGVGRSGTTLLGKVLGMHPQIGFLNEPKALWQAALGDDDLIGSYSRRPGRYVMDAEDADPVRVARLRRYYHAFARLSGSRVVADKYPELIFRPGFLARALPGARQVVILRDGWQTAASIAAWSSRHGRDGADWWGLGDRKWRLLVDQVIRPDPGLAPLWPVLDELAGDADRAAVEWLATVRQAGGLESSGAKALIVRLEEIADDPQGQITRIFAFCGLPPDPVALAYAGTRIRMPRAYPRPVLHPVVAALMAQTMAELDSESRAA